MDIEGEYEVLEGGSKGVTREDRAVGEARMSKANIKRLNHRHRYIMELLLYQPHLTLTQIAKKVNGTVSWVSLVIGSDLFQSELHRQRTALDGYKRDKLASRMLDSGEKALDRMDKILDDDDASDSVATTAAKNVLTSLGFMATGGASVNVQVNNDNRTSVAGVTPEMLAKVKDRRN